MMNTCTCHHIAATAGIAGPASLAAEHHLQLGRASCLDPDGHSASHALPRFLRRPATGVFSHDATCRLQRAVDPRPPFAPPCCLVDVQHSGVLRSELLKDFLLPWHPHLGVELEYGSSDEGRGLLMEDALRRRLSELAVSLL